MDGSKVLKKILGIVVSACIVIISEYIFFSGPMTPITKQSERPIRLESLKLDLPEKIPTYFVDQKDINGQQYTRGIKFVCTKDGYVPLTSSSVPSEYTFLTDKISYQYITGKIVLLSSTEYKSPTLIRISSSAGNTYTAVYDPSKMKDLKFTANLCGSTKFTISLSYLNSQYDPKRIKIEAGIVECFLSNDPNYKVNSENAKETSCKEQTIAKSILGKWSLHGDNDPKAIGQIEIKNFKDNHFTAVCSMKANTNEKDFNTIYSMAGSIDPITNIIVINGIKWIKPPCEQTNWMNFLGVVNSSVNVIQAQGNIQMKKEEF